MCIYGNGTLPGANAFSAKRIITEESLPCLLYTSKNALANAKPEVKEVTKEVEVADVYKRQLRIRSRIYILSGICYFLQENVYWNKSELSFIQSRNHSLSFAW